MRLRRAFLRAVLLSVSSLRALGQYPVEREWNEKIKKSTAALKEGNYKRALRLSTSIIDEMVEALGSGDRAARAFCFVLTHRALALAGLGRNEDALWDWHTVLSLYPSFSRSDLSLFGEPGAFLRDHPLLTEADREGYRMPEGACPPRELSRVKIKFPEGARSFRTTGTLEVEVLITGAGTINAPAVVTPLPSPTLSYVALDAIRKWRYAPAMYDGAAIPAPLTVRVTFELR